MVKKHIKVLLCVKKRVNSIEPERERELLFSHQRREE